MRSADDRRAALQHGAAAEEFVAALYRREGWTIVDRNLRIGGAELDIVAVRNEEVRFVEVKARDPNDPIGLDVITPEKQRRLVRGAEAWLQHYDDLVERACFDVVMVHLGPDGMRVERLENAFDA